MKPLELRLPPPELWQQFENLTLEVFKVYFGDSHADLYGSAGQKQSGVDIFGTDKRIPNNHTTVVVQCKQRGKSGTKVGKGRINEKTIRDEVGEFDSGQFNHASHFIIATTTFRDVALQNIVESLNVSRSNNRLARVGIWFWDFYQDLINRHENLLYGYYHKILLTNDQYDLNIHTLTTLQTAFSRPAFSTPFMSEERDTDFLQALKDTLEAINTGRLMDRQGNIVRSSPPYTSLRNETWKKKIASVENTLEELRSKFTDGMSKGVVHQEYMRVVVSDYALLQYLDKYRIEALRTINEVLVEAGLDQVRSRISGPSLDSEN